ncbi:hypothetical protein CL622_07685 [archaeon]|nr:hypothetical protein [archaeon]|tara:strand:+ start:608 stop:889 length:282 start_codon:yes stop_codon:yes gene_type:complete
MTDKFVEDIKIEQQRIADLIVQLKGEIGQVTSSVAGKESQIQELAGKLDVLKQVHDFYVKGAVEQTQQQAPEPEPAQEPQSVFTPEQTSSEQT